MWIRFWNVITILLFLELFGFIDPETFMSIKGSFKLVDIAFLSAIVPTIYRLAKDRLLFREMFKIVSVKLILAYGVLAAISAVNTYIGGEITILQIFQQMRYFLFPYMLFLPIMVDIYQNDGIKFYYQFIFFIATISTLIIILATVVQVDWFYGLPKITASFAVDYVSGVKRINFMAFVFPILGFLLSFWKYREEKSLKYMLMSVFFAFGFIFQGFRSYIVAGIISISATLIYQMIKSKKAKVVGKLTIVKKIVSSVIVLLLVGLIVPFILGININDVVDRIFSAFIDFINVQGTYAFRINDDLFRWQLFFTNPIFGVGFVHIESQRAVALGLQEEGSLSLYTTDSGYLNILVLYGILGMSYFIAFVAILWKKFIHLYNFVLQNKHICLTGACFVLIMGITQITHGGLTGTYGIIPLVMIMSISEGISIRKELPPRKIVV